MANPAFDVLLGGVGGAAVTSALGLWTSWLAYRREGRKFLQDERRNAFTDLIAAADDLTDAKQYATQLEKDRLAALAASDAAQAAHASALHGNQFHMHQEIEQRVNRALASISLLGNQEVSDTGGKLVGLAALDFEEPRRVAAMEAFVNACRTDLGVEGPPWRYTHDTLLWDVAVAVDETDP